MWVGETVEEDTRVYQACILCSECSKPELFLADNVCNNDSGSGQLGGQLSPAVIPHVMNIQACCVSIVCHLLQTKARRPSLSPCVRACL